MFRDQLKKFRDDEEGALLAFVVIMFVIMIVGAGMAVDFIRHETARADLQNALDRGVLAAADIEQQWADTDTDGDGDLVNEYTALVRSYMRTRAFGANPNLIVTPDIQLNSKKISASANYEMKTYFLRIFGWDRMNVPAYAEAVEGRQKTEISLVLDVSGSMYDNTLDYPCEDAQLAVDPNCTTNGMRITLLKREAKKFVADLINADPTGTDRTISIVPYSHQVSLPSYMAQRYTQYWANREHDYSYCMDFQPTDYPTLAIDPLLPWSQYQHFLYNSSEGVDSCSSAANSILPFSNNINAADVNSLQSKIEGLEEEAWTSVYLGMRWGAAMLDPSFRSVVNGMITSGNVSGTFTDLPRDYGTDQTIKIVILMSDGVNTLMPKMRQTDYDNGGDGLTGADYWKDNQPNRGRVNRYDEEGDLQGSRQVYGKNNNYAADWGSVAYNSVGTYLSDANGNPIPQGDARLFEACDAAKAEKVVSGVPVPGSGIVVYTIGFEANAAADAALEFCGSPGKFYDANGSNLRQVFSAIVNDIDKLQLTN